MNHLIRELINKLPKKIRLTLAKIYFSNLLKKRKLESSEIEYKKLDVWLKEGDNCLDIGSNIGRYTFKMSQIIGQKGHVFSFEPMSESFNILTHLCQVFNLTNVTLFNTAVGDKIQMVDMKKNYLPKTSEAWFDTNTASQISSDPSNLSILCLPIDCLNVPVNVKLVKIDVEGYEVKVLNGMRNLIERDKPIFIVENNDFEIPKFFMKIGYRKIKIEESSRNEVYMYDKQGVESKLLSRG